MSCFIHQLSVRFCSFVCLIAMRNIIVAIDHVVNTDHIKIVERMCIAKRLLVDSTQCYNSSMDDS